MSPGRWFLVLALVVVAFAERLGHFVLGAALGPALADPQGPALAPAALGEVLGARATALALAPLAGLLAGLFLAPRLALLAGGALSVGGALLLGVGERGPVYLGLGALVLGEGLLRPAILAALGAVVVAADGVRRGLAVALVVLAANLGAFLAPVGGKLASARLGARPDALLGLSAGSAAAVALVALVLAFALARSEREAPEAGRGAGAASLLALTGLAAAVVALFFALRPEGLRTVLGPAALPLAQAALLVTLAVALAIQAARGRDASLLGGLGVGLLLVGAAGASMLLSVRPRSLAGAEVALRAGEVLVMVFAAARLPGLVGRRQLLAGAAALLLVTEAAPLLVSRGLVPVTDPGLRWAVVLAGLAGVALVALRGRLEVALGGRAAPPRGPARAAPRAKVKLARGGKAAGHPA
jgi:hypothetical protein